MNNCHFKAEKIGEGIDMSIDGNGIDLANLFANVFYTNPDIRDIVMMALLAVEEKENGDEEPSDDNIINALKVMGKVGVA